MVFSSTVFLFIFLPVVFGLYCLIPERHIRNGLLIVASLIFYAFGEPFVVFLMVISILVNYVLGLTMQLKQPVRRVFLFVSLFWNLGLLGVYKYAGFFAMEWNRLPFFDVTVPDIPLPIGISFFTFQAMSYVIDVYRGDIAVQKNPFRLLLYITLFPQLIAGPIVKYKDIESQLAYRPMKAYEVAQGIRRFILGLSKKLLIADTISIAADHTFALPVEQLTLPLAWLGSLCYTLQIYFDFSGYSDMAIGLGQMFGFTFKENFNYPYYSASMTEFWRRWHISVSTWFKEYLYIPLGGNRKGKVRTAMNKWAVFFCTGLWHGAAGTFIVWGLVNGGLMMLENTLGIGKPGTERKHPFMRGFGRSYTMLMTILCFTMFRANSVTHGLQFWRAMFGFDTADSLHRRIGWALFQKEFTPLMIATIAIAFIFSQPVVPFLKRKVDASGGVIRTASHIFTYVLTLVLMVLCLLYLSAGTYSPFIYLNF